MRIKSRRMGTGGSNDGTYGENQGKGEMICTKVHCFAGE
jgi:hypothetical protein